MPCQLASPWLFFRGLKGLILQGTMTWDGTLYAFPEATLPLPQNCYVLSSQDRDTPWFGAYLGVAGCVAPGAAPLGLTQFSVSLKLSFAFHFEIILEMPKRFRKPTQNFPSPKGLSRCCQLSPNVLGS